MVAEAGADVALVGDSLAMTALGYDTTLPVTLDEMLHHCRAAGRGLEAWRQEQLRRGSKRPAPLLICDLPFLSYQCNADEAVAAAGRALKEAPAAGVKLEGAEPETLAVIDRALSGIRNHMVLASLLLAGLLAAAILWIARRIARPLEQLGVQRAGAGVLGRDGLPATRACAELERPLQPASQARRRVTQGQSS